jgi:hypothetical protein
VRLFQGVWQPVVPSFVRDGDSFQWVVDVVEWLSLGRELADGLSPPGVDVRLELAGDPLEWAVCQQLVRLGKLHDVYAGSFLLMDFCLVFVPFGHYDEAEILPYENSSICPRGVHVGQSSWFRCQIFDPKSRLSVPI